MEKKALTTHKLHYILANIHYRELNSSLESFVVTKKIHHLAETDEQTVKRHYRYDNTMTARLKFIINYQLKSDLRDEFVSSIYIDHFGEDEDFIKNWYMTESDLRVMNSHGNSMRKPRI